MASDAARKLGLQVPSMEARGSDALRSAFDAMANERAQALLVLLDPIVFNYRDQIGTLATKHRLPAIADARALAVAGLLLTYAVGARGNWRRAAGYVDKILKGTKPAELPVEQPTKFELVINMKTAKALGIKIPNSILLQADEVVQ